MNPTAVAARLRAAGLPVLRIIETDDPQVEDHEVDLTETVSVQVPSELQHVGCCVVRREGDAFRFYPVRCSLAEVIADARKAMGVQS